MKKIIVAGAVLLALIGAGGILGYHSYRDSRAEVFSVNGTRVYEEEFRLAMQEKTADTYRYFEEKYGETDSKKFWTKPFDGMTPSDYIKELAKTELVEKKCRMALMKEHGLIEDDSFEAFQAQWKAENKRRKQAAAQGEVIYGPVEYGIVEYDIYLMSNRELELKRTLSQSVLSSTEEACRQYYEENKDVKYKVQDTITIDAEGELLTFEPQFSRHDSTEYPELHKEALEMRPGEIKTVTLMDGEQVAIKCLDKQSNGYLSYDDALDSIRQALTDEKYEALVAERVQNAQVAVNHKKYSRLKL